MAYPRQDGAAKMANPISPNHAEELVEHGYTVVPGFLGPAELGRARRIFYDIFQALRSWRPRRSVSAGSWMSRSNSRWSSLMPATPSTMSQRTRESLLLLRGSSAPAKSCLSQSAIWAKYAGTGDFDQGLHCDYQGNTLVYPRDDGDFRQVNLILYYSDVTEDLGPTCVVPQEQLAPLVALAPLQEPQAASGSLSQGAPDSGKGRRTAHLRHAHVSSCFGHDRRGRACFSHHLVYRAAGHGFQGYHQWSRFGENPHMQRFIEPAIPRQREVLGFPPPGHEYWNAETLAGVAARYPRMDMKPYRHEARSNARRPN